jgi:hypothetical protein
VWPALDVGEGHVVRGDESGTGTALDAHVAHGHPLLHVQGADRLTGVFEDVARPASHPDSRDQGQDDVLGADAGREPSIDPDLVGLRPALEEALRGEHHLDLARADPERERPKGAMGRGMAVAADDGHPRLGQPELGADDVHDALVRGAQAVQRDPELAAVIGEHLDLRSGHLVRDRQGAIVGRDRVVRRRHGLAGPADLQPTPAQARERLRAGHLVDEMEIDRQDGRRAGLLADDVIAPDLLDESAGSGRAGHAASARLRFGSGGARGYQKVVLAPPDESRRVPAVREGRHVATIPGRCRSIAGPPSVPPSQVPPVGRWDTEDT